MLAGITADLSTRARWQSCQQRYLERMGGMDEEMRILHIQYPWYVSGFLHAVKFHDIGLPALLPVRRKVCCGLLSPLKIHRLGRILTRDLWVQWQIY
jgi:hypothetical protein